MLTQLGPLNTPPIIKHLILWTTVLTLSLAAIQVICDQFGLTPGPVQLFSLSWQGISHFYLWQPLTFLFMQPYSPLGITFFSLISLFFSMYILWVLGTSIYALVGKWAFIRFYFICGAAAGIVALLAMPLTGKYALIAGSSPAILALLIAWSMAYPENEILLFFLIPIRAKWIAAGLACAILLVALSQWDTVALFLYFSAILFGYIYACAAWGWRSPFPAMQPIDAFLATIGLKLRKFFILPHWLKFKKNKIASSSNSKIIDINTGTPIANDDAFIDQMLAKISKYGERSLTWSERRRMQQISERKRKKDN